MFVVSLFIGRLCLCVRDRSSVWFSLVGLCRSRLSVVVGCRCLGRGSVFSNNRYWVEGVEKRESSNERRTRLRVALRRFGKRSPQFYSEVCPVLVIQNSFVQGHLQHSVGACRLSRRWKRSGFFFLRSQAGNVLP